MKRRRFLTFLGLSPTLSLGACSAQDSSQTDKKVPSTIKPIVISTWRHGFSANKAAWTILSSDGKAIDAVEKGVMDSESDPENTSVGLGGLPDRDGKVTLDACIMDEKYQCGAVAFLQDIENPICVARKVMDETEHVMLVGQGALDFAISKGFQTTNLLTEKSKKAWLEWKEKSEYKTPVNVENHDTIGMLALDSNGDLSGACTTSGLAYKMHGRVGDSPIIGAGLYVDNEIGAACATGVGEMVIRTVGSHLVVELMRQGKSPEEACKIAVERIIQRHGNVEGMQVGFLALNKQGEHGGYAIYEGFDYALRTPNSEEMVATEFEKKW